MRMTLQIDKALLKAAREACGAATDEETVRRGLETLLRDAAYQRIRQLRGSEAGAKDTLRRKKLAEAQKTAHERYGKAFQRLAE